MKINQTICLTEKKGKQFIARRLLRADKLALQHFASTLSKTSTAHFLPHAYDDKTVNAMLERSECGKDLTMGLFDGERLIAYFFLWYFEEPIPLLGIGLQDDYQGRGLGMQIMKLLIEEARNNGCDGIELTTLPDNQTAFTLYESVGFKHYADLENMAGDGRIVIERAMFLQFNPKALPSKDLHKPPLDFSAATE